MENLLNVKTNWKHATLEYLIKKYDSSQDMSRAAVFKREVKAAEGVNNWKEVQLLLSDLKQEEDLPIFRNFQARYGEETATILKKVREDILSQLKETGLKVLQSQYMLLLLQLNYLEKLKLEKLLIKGDRMMEENKVDMPEMAKLLCEMMLTDKESEELQKIKNILVNWKNNKNV